MSLTTDDGQIKYEALSQKAKDEPIRSVPGKIPRFGGLIFLLLSLNSKSRQ